MLRRAALLFLFALGCSSSQNLGPPVTCTMTFTSANGSCTFDPAQPCSDGNFYTIDCQDDSTCSCDQNGTPVTSIIASNMPSGYCATIDATSVHDIAAKCGWNINP